MGRDPGLAEREAGVARAQRQRPVHHQPALRQRALQARAEHAVEEAAAAQHHAARAGLQRDGTRGFGQRVGEHGVEQRGAIGRALQQTRQHGPQVDDAAFDGDEAGGVHLAHRLSARAGANLYAAEVALARALAAGPIEAATIPSR